MSFIKPLLSQRRVDQAIKNFIINPYGRSHATLNLCGGSCVQLVIYRSKVTAYLNDTKKVYPLGFYYSEDLETDPEIDYPAPPSPFYTYDTLLDLAKRKKQEIDAKKKSKAGLNITNLPDFLPDNDVKIIQVKAPKSETSTPVSNPEPIEVSEEKEPTSPPPAETSNKELKESLERRLRILDLKIEREEILSQLADL